MILFSLLYCTLRYTKTATKTATKSNDVPPPPTHVPHVCLCVWKETVVFKASIYYVSTETHKGTKLKSFKISLFKNKSRLGSDGDRF